MTISTPSTHQWTLALPGETMTEEGFYRFCQMNPDMRIERDAQQNIYVMPPTSSETGRWNAELLIEIGLWNRATGLGVVFDSSTGFSLPDGSERSPDISWVEKKRWDNLSGEDKRRFSPIVPDFVVELRSFDQPLGALKSKMEEYMSCGCRLGWLVDPQDRKTFVFKQDGSVQVMSFQDFLDGGDVLPGFSLKMDNISA